MKPEGSVLFSEKLSNPPYIGYVMNFLFSGSRIWYQQKAVIKLINMQPCKQKTLKLNPSKLEINV
jgi:hypothetical protein